MHNLNTEQRYVTCYYRLHKYRYIRLRKAVINLRFQAIYLVELHFPAWMIFYSCLRGKIYPIKWFSKHTESAVALSSIAPLFIMFEHFRELIILMQGDEYGTSFYQPYMRDYKERERERGGMSKENSLPFLCLKRKKAHLCSTRHFQVVCRCLVLLRCCCDMNSSAERQINMKNAQRRSTS